MHTAVRSVQVPVRQKWSIFGRLWRIGDRRAYWDWPACFGPYRPQRWRKRPSLCRKSWKQWITIDFHWFLLTVKWLQTVGRSDSWRTVVLYLKKISKKKSEKDLEDNFTTYWEGWSRGRRWACLCGTPLCSKKSTGTVASPRLYQTKNWLRPMDLGKVAKIDRHRKPYRDQPS